MTPESLLTIQVLSRIAALESDQRFAAVKFGVSRAAFFCWLDTIKRISIFARNVSACPDSVVALSAETELRID